MIKKQILSLLLAMLMVMTLVPTALAEDDVVAYEVTGGNIYFDKTTGTVTSCDPEVTEANIPSEIDGVAVTSIADWAFISCFNSLTSIDIPCSVKYIGYDIFSGGYSLTNISVAEDNTAYCSVDGILFNKDKTKLIKYPAKKTDASYSIPDSVTSIGYAAFCHCMSLTSVTIPDSVTDIDAIAFAGCTNLTSIRIPDSVKSIIGVFDGCTSLTSITIPSSVTSIGLAAFQDCINLTDVTISNGVTSIYEVAFAGCTGLTSITIPSSVTSIIYDPFQRCTSLTSIKVADANTAYSSVNGVLFNKDITELVRYPEGKVSTAYAIPDSVTSIDSAAFNSCTGLTSLVLPDSVTSIDGSAFYDCMSLADVYYTGSAEQWNAIKIGDLGNEALLNATIHYNYHEHVTELVGAKAATCTEAGYTGDEVCSICGETIKEGEVIPATGHHFKGNTCPDCGETRSTADTIRAWFQESFNNMKNFFDKIFGRN